ncbi:hypothetical protein [Streptomyces chrestomyceticus]|uniref:hypothetical protein n=1 Tax=Streptomyces chrestomyceticus TaxID=68185 RepID=UPI00340A0A20
MSARGASPTRARSTWKYAAQITAGRFNAAEYVTNLMVRWTDGELTLYTGVSSGTFGQEHQLKARNESWEHATLLAAGEFSGNCRCDLMVRWSDGELDTYTGTTPRPSAPRRVSTTATTCGRTTPS